MAAGEIGGQRPGSGKDRRREAGGRRQEKTRVRGQEKRLPVAKELGETSLMLMVHPTLSGDDMEDVVRAVDKVMRGAVR